MKNLKLFETHQQYEAAESSLILPNVSFCLDTPNVVHYKPRRCEETSVYEIVGTPSYPATVDGADSSFDITVNYRRTDTDTACTDTVTEGTDTVTVEIGANPSTSNTRTVTGTVDYYGNEIEYSIEQSKMTYKITYTAPVKLSQTTNTDAPGLHTNAFNTSIVSHTFEDGIGTIIFADEVLTIGQWAFHTCSGLTSINIPDSVTSIGVQAFNNCSGLTSIDIPNSVRRIGNGAFYNCTGLISIVIPDNVTSIGSSTFINCYSLTSCTIGSGITSIGKSTFYKCSGLTSVSIPSGVTNIGSDAFSNCSGLTSITTEAAIPPTLESSTGGMKVFENTNNCPIYVPGDSVNTYKATSGWNDYASRIQAIP